MAAFQAAINLGASAPTAAQQAATDALVAGVLVGVQSSGLAGYNVSAVNYTVVANFSTTTITATATTPIISSMPTFTTTLTANSNKQNFKIILTRW